MDQTWGRGIMPLTFEALKGQRYRWRFGGIQIVRMHWRSLLPGRTSHRNHLTAGQRWAYLAGAVQRYGDLLGLIFFVFLLAGAANLATGGGELFRKLTAFLLATIPVLVVLGLVRVVALLRRGTGASWRDAIGAFFIWQSTSLVVARASLAGLFARKAAFLRTPKTSEHSRWWEALRANWPESALAVVGAAGIAGALSKATIPSGVEIAALLLIPTLGMAAAPINSWAAQRATLPAWLRERRRTEHPAGPQGVRRRCRHRWRDRGGWCDHRRSRADAGAQSSSGAATEPRRPRAGPVNGAGQSHAVTFRQHHTRDPGPHLALGGPHLALGGAHLHARQPATAQPQRDAEPKPGAHHRPHRAGDTGRVTRRCPGDWNLSVRAAIRVMDETMAGQPAGIAPGVTVRDLAEGAGLLAATANVIMQLARPEVGYGVLESTVERGQVMRHPVRRWRTTLTYLSVALMGSTTEREAYRRAVVDRSHAQVRSTPHSPVSYNAFDPRLQLWVAACLYRGIVDVRTLLHGPADDRAADAIYRRASRLGTTLQVPEGCWPADRAAFGSYWDAALATIRIDPPVRAYLDKLIMLGYLPRPVSIVLGPLNRFLTTGFLPPPFREQMRLPWTERDQRQFESVMRVIAAVNRRLPPPVRRFPFNACLRGLRARTRWQRISGRAPSGTRHITAGRSA